MLLGDTFNGIFGTVLESLSTVSALQHKALTATRLCDNIHSFIHSKCKVQKGGLEGRAQKKRGRMSRAFSVARCDLSERGFERHDLRVVNQWWQ